MLSPAELDEGHLEPFRRAMLNVLSTPVAEFTFAQIVDGQPTSEAIQAYQDTVLGTTTWKLRLLELVAIACHGIAVYLYQMDDGVHKHAEHEAWRDNKLKTLPENDLMGRNTLPPATLFWTGAYMDWSQYPNGLADMAGYWAEMRIFGGIVLFDRGESENECNGIYIHNQRYTTIAPPTEAQFNNLTEFLKSESPDYEQSPLPIEVTSKNKWRWDPYDARTRYHIFKHRYDIPTGPRPRRKDVITEDTWPEITNYYRLAEEDLEHGLSDKTAREAARDEIAMTISPSSRLWETLRERIKRLQPDEKRQGRPPYFFDP